MLLLSCVGCGLLAPVKNGSDNELKREQFVRSLLEASVESLRQNKLDEARAQLRLANEVKPKDARILDGLGCLAWRESDYGLATYYFQQAITLRPDYDRAYAHLALIAQAEGNIKAALQLLEKAISLNPQNYRARNNYGVILLEQDSLDKTAKKLGFRELIKAYVSTPKPDAVLKENYPIAQEGLKK